MGPLRSSLTNYIFMLWFSNQLLYLHPSGRELRIQNTNKFLVSKKKDSLRTMIELDVPRCSISLFHGPKYGWKSRNPTETDKFPRNPMAQQTTHCSMSKNRSMHQVNAWQSLNLWEFSSGQLPKYKLQKRYFSSGITHHKFRQILIPRIFEV